MSLYLSTFSAWNIWDSIRKSTTWKEQKAFGCFFCKEYLRHGIPTGTDSQHLGQQCGAITLVFEGVKESIEIYRKCKKLQVKQWNTGKNKEYSDNTFQWRFDCKPVRLQTCFFRFKFVVKVLLPFFVKATYLKAPRYCQGPSFSQELHQDCPHTQGSTRRKKIISSWVSHRSWICAWSTSLLASWRSGDVLKTRWLEDWDGGR